MDRLMDLFLDGELGKKDYEEKRLELVQKRENTIKEIEAHHKADDSFANMLVSLVSLASNALEIFNCSTISEKRYLVNLVFANLTLSPSKLDYNVRPPFDSFINLSQNPQWWAIEDLNL